MQSCRDSVTDTRYQDLLSLDQLNICVNHVFLLPPPPRGSARGGARPRWASRHKWLTKTRNEPQGGARVRKDGLLRFQARSAQLERATKLAARIGWELSVFSSLFSTGRDWRSSIARKLRREKDCRCLGVRGLTSWLPTKHTWDCSYFLRPPAHPGFYLEF